MVLSLQQVKELIKKPANLQSLREAVDHEERVKMHTKAVDDESKASAYFPKFLSWVSDGIRLPADKFTAFKGMCRFPLPTTALCNSIFDEYEKIFTAQDSYFDVELLDDTLKVEFKQYLADLKVRKYFQAQGFQAYKKQHGCIYVVDLPSLQTSLRPLPYFYKVPIKHVVDIGIERMTDGTERISYIIFKYGKNKWIAIDDETYRMFEYREPNGKPVAEDIPLPTLYTDENLWMVTESSHPLGYTPATFLSHNPLYDDQDESPVPRRITISDSAGDLDWLLFYKIAERLYETYGPFPIMTVPETDCTYQEGENRCTSGFVAYVRGDGSWSYKECPNCAKNNLVGPGSIFSRPVPKSKDDPNIGDPVTITPPNVESLDYITKKIDFLEWFIYENNVGNNDEMVTKEAVNEKQVMGSVEGKKNILNKIKKDFEQTEKFIIDTMGRLMYGDYYVTCTVNYGEQFLLATTEEVTYQYQEFKKAGLPTYLVNAKKQLLVQTEHRNNPAELKRAELLDMLEPWPDLSLNDCLTHTLNIRFPEKFLVKLDFTKYVSKFELANGDIVQWGSLLSLETKINKLSEILTNYGKEDLKSAIIPEPEPAGSGARPKKT